MQAIGSVRRAWRMLCIIALLSLGLGYLYLIFMKIFAKPLVYVTLIILIVSLLGSGSYMIMTAKTATVPATATVESTTGNATTDIGAIAETAAESGITVNEVE